MSVQSEVIEVLATTLQLGDRAARMDRESELLGVIPEFDSMAVVTVLTELEERFDIEVSDDDIDAATFQTVGTLMDFVETKLTA